MRYFKSNIKYKELVLRRESLKKEYNQKLLDVLSRHGIDSRLGFKIEIFPVCYGLDFIFPPPIAEVLRSIKIAKIRKDGGVYHSSSLYSDLVNVRKTMDDVETLFYLETVKAFRDKRSQFSRLYSFTFRGDRIFVKMPEGGMVKEYFDEITEEEFNLYHRAYLLNNRFGAS